VKFYKAIRNNNKCLNCNICKEIISCPGKFNCIGCMACYLACPNEAIELIESEIKREIKVIINGEVFYVPENITILKALELLGYKISKFPNEGDIFAPCCTGGCYCCAVEVNGEIKPSCITKIEEGMNIKTKISKNLRRLDDWIPHPVGGVGTPWWIKGKGYIEIAVFSCGCNLRCPQCQNWMITYNSKEKVYTPREAAIIMTKYRLNYGIDRMAISGGECTLNREWLIEYIKELKKLNKDEKARIHIDTNTTILTKDYIDELVEAGMTDIGPDLKGYYLDTFMKITGINDREIAEKYHKTSWEAVKYLIDNYKDKVFIGIGIPYNKKLISIEEIEKIGDEIYKIDPEVQICILDYRPEFRNRKISRPSFMEMAKIWEILKSKGLKTVICQTELGHIGP
jgi:pyruvate formate lyase activating enzyme